MAKTTVHIDKRKLLGELSAGRNLKVTSNIVKTEVDKKIKKSQDDLVREYENHPVTQEIDAGPNASNSSGTLDGKGNLFSFIGFNRGDNPTAPVKARLARPIKSKVSKASFGNFKVEVDAATKQELEEVSPIPWSIGRSWLDGIEKGISGLGRYIFKGSNVKSSRSGTAIQVTKSKGGRFKNTSYISKMLNNFYKRISK
tara:strand:+ start:1505 stop:2101 length:597 start_codon:yes stop_codon:yes gene_type:complete